MPACAPAEVIITIWALNDILCFFCIIFNTKYILTVANLLRIKTMKNRV